MFLRNSRPILNNLLLSSFILLIFISSTIFADVLTPEKLLNLKSVGTVKISPDGNYAAYTVYVPRTAKQKPGGSYSELYIVNLKTKKHTPFITGNVNVSSISWSPDGSSIAFSTRRGSNKKNQVWLIPVSGGEARQITDSETGISTFRWHPSGKKIAFTTSEPKTAKEIALKENGYVFIYYEENLKHRNLHLVDILENEPNPETKQLTEDITIWSFEFSQDGKTIAIAATEKNLIDYNYMFKRIHLLDIETKELKQITKNPGKLGNFVFSPNGKQLAYTAAISRNDHAVSQVFTIPIQGGEATNLTIENFHGHVNWVGWKDNNTVIYRAAEGMLTTLNEVKIKDKKHKQLLSSGNNGGIAFYSPSYTTNFKNFVFSGSSPNHPNELFSWQPGKKFERLTNLNPELAEIELGKQSVISYKAEDGLEIEGLLIHPVGYKKGEKYPLVVFVHGGPESNYSNRWVSGYSTPGQVLAGNGYTVFYPNYRASTGYGVEFAAAGLGDAGGKEFDDVKDGIKHLIDTGIADPERVGLGGGSYGGYAAAWFATYYTDYVKAACMFVGVSNLISKRGTTDIPYEEMYVHSGRPLEDMWIENLKRSPVYYAHQSKTATLIFGGADDPRVHPAQSLELYRRMKMNDHPAVRLVQYPGEGHGNRRQPGRIDVVHRVIDWYDWYVKESKPLDGPMPPLDISDKYGIELPDSE